MFKSTLTRMLLVCTLLVAMQQTVHASVSHVYVAHNITHGAATQTGFRGLVKNSIQYTAGGIALGSLGYSAYELTQALKHWIQTNNDDPNDIHREERNQSALRMLAAFAVAVSTGIVCYADFSTIDAGPVLASFVDGAFRYFLHRR